MKAKRQIESSLNSVTMLDGTGGHVSTNTLVPRLRLYTYAYCFQALRMFFLS